MKGVLAPHEELRPKGGPIPTILGPKSLVAHADVEFWDEMRSNKTRASTTDPDALHYVKSPDAAAKLFHMGHILMKNWNRLVVDAEITPMSGHAQRVAALEIIDEIVNTGDAEWTMVGKMRLLCQQVVADLRECTAPIVYVLWYQRVAHERKEI